MVKKFMVLFGLFLIILGCQDKGLCLRVSFDQVEGLKENDRVVFDQNHIGRVVGVKYEESGTFTVSVEIKKAFAKAVTEHARFFIVADPRDNTKKAVEMIQVSKGGMPLEDGVTVKGSSKYSALFDRTWEAFENGFDDLEEQFEKFSDQFRNIPESEAYKDLEKELERLSQELKQAGEAANEKMEKEVLPRLKKELEKLKEKLFELQKKNEAEEPLEV